MGLTIVGVTDEPEDLTAQWVEKHGVEFAYAYDRNGLGSELNVSGIPQAFLVDGVGKIVWLGHPFSLAGTEPGAAHHHPDPGIPGRSV